MSALTKEEFAAWTERFSAWRKETDEKIASLTRRINIAEARLKDGKQAPTSAAVVATDADLEGERGDPEVRRNPPRWDGDDMTGRRWSQTSPEFLGVMASFLDWKAAHPMEGKEQYAKFDRLDAARARAWAKRLAPGSAWRADAQDDAHESSSEDGDELADFGGSEIPF